MKRSRFGKDPTHPSERFWDKVDKLKPNACWEWQGARYPNGYGFLYAGILYEGGGLWVMAHRLSFELHHGQVPDGLFVLHTCDNPPCVNPAHLYTGTKADNAHDRAVRRRGKEHRQNGEDNDNAKLTDADVLKIIALLNAGKLSQAAIGEKFGVKQPLISRIKSRTVWRHLWEA